MSIELRGATDRGPAAAGGAGAPCMRPCVWYAVALVIFAVLAAAASWRWYPLFVDAYYHMAAVEGFRAAGGLVTQASWEMAPAGRVHIYPPALHVIGYLLTFIGISARTYVTWLSGGSYAACLISTWLWLRRVIGPRAALVALVLLCGPSAFVWNQAVHTANALVLVLAPLALLALAADRYLICGVLNLAVIASHPFGLFLPPALVVNTILRRRGIAAGLLAAAVPVALYAPWLGHIWANRAFLTEDRTSGELSLRGPGLSIGLSMLLGALPGVWSVLRRRGGALGLIGPLLGFAVVLPMGFGGRFFTFNVHWPLACLAGLGYDALLRWRESRPGRGALARVAGACLAVASLLVFVSLDWRPAPVRPGFRPGAGAVPAPARAGRGPMPIEGRPRPGWRLALQPGALSRFFDPAPPGPGGAQGPGGADLIHRAGAAEFLVAVREHVGAGDVIHVVDPPLGSLIAGVAGRRTTGAILRDVVAAGPAARPPDCHYLARMEEGGVPPAGPGHLPPARRPGPGGPPSRGPGALGAARPQPGAPPGFSVVFQNEFGSLFRNDDPPADAAPVAAAVLPAGRLFGIVLAGALLAALDLLPGCHRGMRLLGGTLAVLAVALCIAPLTRAAAWELADPPGPPAGRGGAPAAVPDEELLRQHEQVIQAVEEWLAAGRNPDMFWPPMAEERLRALLEQGDIEEAREMVSRAAAGLVREDGAAGQE